MKEKEEIKVYVIDCSDIPEGKYVEDLTDEEFKDIAEKNDNIYTLEQFEYDFNMDEYVSTINDYIRFI